MKRCEFVSSDRLIGRYGFPSCGFKLSPSYRTGLSISVSSRSSVFGFHFRPFSYQFFLVLLVVLLHYWLALFCCIVCSSPSVFLLISFHIGKISVSLFSIYCVCIVIAYCPNFAGLNTSSGSFLVVVAADGGDCSNGDVVVTVLVPSVSGSY